VSKAGTFLCKNVCDPYDPVRQSPRAFFRLRCEIVATGRVEQCSPTDDIGIYFGDGMIDQ